MTSPPQEPLEPKLLENGLNKVIQRCEHKVCLNLIFISCIIPLIRMFNFSQITCQHHNIALEKHVFFHLVAPLFTPCIPPRKPPLQLFHKFNGNNTNGKSTNVGSSHSSNSPNPRSYYLSRDAPNPQAS
jgi:hypothetical protein